MRTLALFSGSFSLGIFLAQYLLPAGWLLPCALGAYALACFRLVLSGDRGKRVLLIGTGLSLAFGWTWLYIRQVQRPMETLADTEAAVTMTLQDYADPTDFGAKVTVRVEGLPGKLAYYGGTELLNLEPGQTVTDTVSFQSAARIRDDDITTFTSKGVFLLAYQRGEAVIGPENPDSPRWWPVRMGQAMREKIGDLFQGDTAGFLTAILTGDKSALSSQASWNLSEAGLYHILAVSGMHCGFLLMLIRLLTGRHRRRLLAGSAIVLLIFYAFLVGASPSVVRACVMLSFLLAAPLFGRESDGPTSLSAALFCILLNNPFAAASISLQLSFGAVAGLLWLTPRLSSLLLGEKHHGRVFTFTVVSFSATMGALVLTIPLSAYYFGTMALISPVSNLLCLTAASGVFIFGLLAVLAGFVCPPLGSLIALVPGLLAQYILEAARLLAQVPYHAVYFVNPYLKYWLAFAYLLFAAVYLLRDRRGRNYALAAGCALATLAVTIRLGAARYGAALDVVMLDVGQGQSVVLASEGHFALTDCGSGNSWYDAGGVAFQQLRTMGCREVDYLILTHFDDDHVNGAEVLLSQIPVRTVLYPADGEDTETRRAILDFARETGAEVTALTEETELALGGAALTVYPPTGGTDDNERGLVVLASAGEEDLLITGDLDAAGERRLLETYGLPDIEYLAAGHHGSKYSTCDELLDAVSPETALISVGSNSYGHPAEETLRRLAEHGCTVYRTDLHGTIHLSIGEAYEENSAQ